jgi:hypothetical protein
MAEQIRQKSPDLIFLPDLFCDETRQKCAKFYTFLSLKKIQGESPWIIFLHQSGKSATK